MRHKIEKEGKGSSHSVVTLKWHLIVTILDFYKPLWHDVTLRQQTTFLDLTPPGKCAGL